MSQSSSVAPETDAGSLFFDLLGSVGRLAEGADKAPVPVSLEDSLLLADVETRLTDEMRRLIDAFYEFGRRPQTIRKDIPASADFTKLITGLLPLFAFQLANSLRQGLDKPILADDGLLYLQKLGMSASELFHEFELDGRKYLGVAIDRGDDGFHNP